MKMSQSSEPRAISQIREFVPSRKCEKQGGCEQLSSHIESPVSHAFSQLSFALLPIDKPQGKQFCSDPESQSVFKCNTE